MSIAAIHPEPGSPGPATQETGNPGPATQEPGSQEPGNPEPCSPEPGKRSEFAAADTIDAFRQVARPAMHSDLLIHVAMPKRITLIYDETCELCRHARRWLEGQRTYIPLDFLAAGQAQTMERYAHVPWLGEELVVVADDGRVWVGPAAFITAMWTTQKFRGWSYRLSGDTFSGMARHFFHTLTTERGRISALLKTHSCDGEQCRLEPPHSSTSTSGSVGARR
jgi:predicted DCC family thiol-disulfide oxidoreductase YuxK